METASNDKVQLLQDRLDIQGSLIDYKAKGIRVELLGKGDYFIGRNIFAYKLKVVFPTGAEKTMYFSAIDYMLLGVESFDFAPGGEKLKKTESFDNYSELPEGIVFAMSRNEWIVKSVEINKPIDEHIFEPTYECLSTDKEKQAGDK